MALACALAASCGIDTKTPTGASGPPDITGTWEGAFTSEVDLGVHAISSLVIVKSGSTRFQLHFDVAEKTPDGNGDPEGLFLETELGEQVNETGIDDQNDLFVSGQNGDLVLSGHVSSGAGHIDGDWLQIAPTQDHGTWSVARVSD